ncbi:MAG TPA: zf-HC2 domain-containing protein [Terriglobia bacterium]|nr:zf-HC2 domain-containing protein [Terriglobia bacterium]
MSCWRFDLRRRMLPYLEARLPEADTARLERHLVDCESCRGLLVRLRAGHQMAQRLASLQIEEEAADAGREIAGLEAALFAGGRRGVGWRDWLERLATPRMVSVLSAVVLLQLGLLVVSNRGVLLSRTPAVRGAVDLAEFRRLTIPELKANTQPHVATDGYVEDVHTDEEEGTVAFKLVQSPQNGSPFVVCEIMSPIQMRPPAEGSRVRVYGVERYDAQQNRKWYEVNPVLSIAPLKP